MDSEFNSAKAEAVKVLEKCIQMGWITVPDFISLDGIAANFASQQQVEKRHNKLREVMSFIIMLNDYYHEEFNQIEGLFAYLKQQNENRTAQMKKVKDK